MREEYSPVRQNLAILAAVILFLAAISFYLLFPAIKQAENEVLGLERLIALQAEDLLTLFLDLTFEDLIEFGQHVLSEHKSYEEISRVFFESRSDFASAAIFDLKGLAITPKLGRDLEAQSVLPPPLAGSMPFERALEGRHYLSPVFFTSLGPVLQLAAPLKKDGVLAGVIVSEVDLSLLWKVASRVSVPDGKIYLVDERGTLIADPDPARSRSGENLRYRETVSALVLGQEESGLGRYTNEKGESVIASGFKMSSTGWGILVEQDERKAFEQREKTFWLAILFAALSVILIFFLSLNTFRLTKALLDIKRERGERERIIEYLPDGIIEYTGENEIISMNPAARNYLGISGPLPRGLRVLKDSPLEINYAKLWAVFQSHPKTAGGQANKFEITFQYPEPRTLEVITVFIKGTGELSGQRYLKIIHLV